MTELSVKYQWKGREAGTPVNSAARAGAVSAAARARANANPRLIKKPFF